MGVPSTSRITSVSESGAAHVRAVARRPVGDRQVVGVERVREQRVGERLEQLAHAALRRPLAHLEFGIVEIALAARQRAADQGLVDEFEVERVEQRLAHPPVLEDGPTHVEDEAGHAGRSAMRDLRLDDGAGIHRRKRVVGGPFRRAALAVDRDLAGGEGLEADPGICEVVIPDPVEVMQPPVVGDVPPPIVRIAVERDEATGLEIPDDVGAGSDRDPQAARGEIDAVPVGLLENRSKTDD